MTLRRDYSTLIYVRQPHHPSRSRTRDVQGEVAAVRVPVGGDDRARELLRGDPRWTGWQRLCNVGCRRGRRRACFGGIVGRRGQRRLWLLKSRPGAPRSLRSVRCSTTCPRISSRTSLILEPAAFEDGEVIVRQGTRSAGRR